MNMGSHKEEKQIASEKSAFTPPSISLPKGGGAIRGMGEKFAANPVTGTGSVTVPIYTSPGRSSFGPELMLSYDSGAGNGPFGFGWHLSIPSITRKTEKGLPRYIDAKESDVFILSGAEDLVPFLIRDGDNWKLEDPPLTRKIHNDTDIIYTIQRYRPRIEGLFARIERWTNTEDPTDTFWRSISKDNITTWYGKTKESRIADPADDSRIFSWLICESYDDKGNLITYGYKAEDATGINLPQVNERNRSARTANRYLKRIRYGYHDPYLPVLDESKPWPTLPDDAAWFFEVVFDYGDHRQSEPLPNDDLAYDWPSRDDPFSSCRSGFEVRTYRLCRRVLMFHHFPSETDIGDNYLVRSTDFIYSNEKDPSNAHNPIYSFLCSVTQTGYKQKTGGGYISKSLPPMEFIYSMPEIDETVHTVAPDSLENLPVGIDGPVYQWIDLDGEGLSGILTEQGGGWFYKRNLGPLPIIDGNGKEHFEARFSPVELVTPQPTLSIASGRAQFMDLAGDGQPDVVQMSGPAPGFFERTVDGDWEPFRSFKSWPNIDPHDPNLRFVDLDGDGHADILITADNIFRWYPSLAEDGFGPEERAPQPFDEEAGPHLVFADGTQSIYLADLSGDGLSDLVRIRNGEVCYWPNLGYGKFGVKVTMDNAPWFDNPDLFDQKRVRLADIDGSGTTDIIYLHGDGPCLYFNQSGNSWSAPYQLAAFPAVDDPAAIQVTDLLGNGTACLVWSSPLPGNAGRQMRYIDLMGGLKPHLLIKTVNNLGAETSVAYAPSTKFYLKDKLDGKPWATKLPFPVHVVESVTIRDNWRDTNFTTSYSYHHGYFDGIEREFRGFGRVEQIDVENFGKFAGGNASSPYITNDTTLYQPPVKTVTWYHTGAFLDRERILSDFSHEYYQPYQEHQLPEPDLEGASLTAEEWREALRACKGMMLRQEVYELDVDALKVARELPVKLFSTAFHNCNIKLIQPKATNRHAVFHVVESEAITYHYELNLRHEPDPQRSDTIPDPRIAHTLNLNIDQYGNVLQSVAVAYRRICSFKNGTIKDDMLTSDQTALIDTVQKELHLAYTENHYTRKDDNTMDIDDPDEYRLRLLCETSVYELTGINLRNGFYFSIDELRGYMLSDKYPTDGTKVTEIDYHEITDPNIPEKRLVEQTRTLFFGSNLKDPLGFGKFNALAIPYETYKLALTEDLLQAIFGVQKLTTDVKDNLANYQISGYLNPTEATTRFGDAAKAGQYWIPSGIAGFAPDAKDHFYLPECYIDPFGKETKIQQNKDNYLYVKSSADPAGNTVSVEQFDYRVLAPREIRDINDNVSEVYFDILGSPTAMALKGKGDEGDNLDNFDDALANPDIDTLITFFTGNYKEAQAREFLGAATARYIYYFGEIEQNGLITYKKYPTCACSILREKHVAQLDTTVNEESPIRTAFEYSDGMGTVLVKKAQAEPDENGSGLRWIATGKTLLNNKGKPVKQYEPYFSSNEHRFEETVEVGVTPVMYYDAVGRLIRTDLPNGIFSLVEFSPWHIINFDPNDTVTESQWYVDRGSPKPEDPKPAGPDKQVAWFTARHAGTPSQTILDVLGREVIVIAHNREKDSSGKYNFDGEKYKDVKYFTFTKLDAEGKPLWICDDRKNLVMQYIIPQMPDDSMHWPDRKIDDYDNGMTNGKNKVYAPCYDIAGNLLFQHSMDAGDRWILNDTAGKPMFAWDNNSSHEKSGTEVAENRFFYTTYDDLHRPKEHWLTINTDTPQMIEQFEYGEKISGVDPKTLNLRGQLYQHFDQSGLKTVANCDFKGNPLEVRRKLASSYTASVIGWQNSTTTAELEPEVFIQITEYDALNRMSRLFNWHQGPESRVAVYEPTYNKRGLLEKEDLILRAVKKEQSKNVKGYQVKTDTQSTTPIEAITYNAKGQREKVKYSNQTITRYLYNPKTFRLAQLRTTRPGYNPPFPSNPSLLKDDQVLQNLYYTYDPVGNITEIHDDAYEPVFFKNQQVDCKNQYTYDALYRLIIATGRENCRNTTAPGQFEGQPVAAQFPVDPQRDPNALCNYTQYFSYDSVGNIDKIRHVVANNDRWTRSYEYAKYSNRLSSIWLGNQQTDAVQYQYDQHGNMLNLTNTDPMYFMNWDYRDMIQSINLGGGGLAYYYYDSFKERTRKVIVDQHGDKKWERIYLGGLEIFRKYNGNGIVEEIESVHFLEEDRRLLLVEDVLQTDSDQYSTGLHFRFQYDNHLGSAVLELDEKAQIISYEEYHPYGTTAYQAMNKDVQVISKRYRFTGKERDEESGLNYHGARYYSPWLGRWVSSDPIGISGGSNLYTYSSARPTSAVDPSGMAPKSWLTKGMTPQNFTNERSVERVVEAIYEYYEWSYQRQVGICVDVGGQPVPGVTDYLAHPPGLTKELQLNEVKRANPEVPNSGAKFTKGQGPHGYLEAAAQGKPVDVPQGAGNVSIKPGSQVTVDVKVIFPEVIQDFEGQVRLKTPGVDSPVKAVPPTIRKKAASGQVTSVAADVALTKAVSPEVQKALPAAGQVTSVAADARLAESAALREGKQAETMLGKRMTGKLPIIGTIIAALLVKEDLAHADTKNAVLDAVGPVPVLGELAGFMQITEAHTAAKAEKEEGIVRGMEQFKPGHPSLFTGATEIGPAPPPPPIHCWPY